MSLLVQKNSECKTVILMATFNGEKYVADQIESILSQSYKNWTLLIRDDGSTDNTSSIINKYSESDERVELLIDDKGHSGSSAHNFNLLCEEALKKNYDYYFFSDQDDVWSSDKIKISLNKVNSLDQNNVCKPLLLYSDLLVIDDEKKIMHQSFMRFQGLKNEDREPLKTLLTQNYVTGCGMMVNRSLLKISCPFPEKIIMHDWWLALCAATIGNIYYNNEPLVNYRQHSFNVVGAKGFWSPVNPFNDAFLSQWNDGRDRLKATILQAQELSLWLEKSNFNDDASCSKKLIKAYSSLLSLSKFNRLKMVLILGVKRQSKLMTLAFLVRVFLMTREKE